MLRFLYIVLFLLPLFISGISIEKATSELPVLPKHPVPVPVQVNPLDTVSIPDGAFLARAEGCTDTFVVPPHPSGPTISCGIDLGAIGARNVTRIFSGLVSDSTIRILVTATKQRGPQAKAWVRANQVHLDSSTTRLAFRRAIALMWVDVHGELLDTQPEPVREALLSYLYHTGHLPTQSRKLKAMSPRNVAALLRSKARIYVGSNSKSFRKRRSLEAKYIEQCCSDTLVVCRAPNSLSSS